MSAQQGMRSSEPRDLVLWPVIITLAVTLLRFAGEMLQWSPSFFSREAGGAGAIIGIVWLIPVFVMALSIFGGLDTHYAKPRPDFPPMGPAGLFFWTALLPQLSIWIYLTVVGGLLFGALGAPLAGRRPTLAAEASA